MIAHEWWMYILPSLCPLGVFLFQLSHRWEIQYTHTNLLYPLWWPSPFALCCEKYSLCLSCPVWCLFPKQQHCCGWSSYCVWVRVCVCVCSCSGGGWRKHRTGLGSLLSWSCVPLISRFQRASWLFAGWGGWEAGVLWGVVFVVAWGMSARSVPCIIIHMLLSQ